MAKSKIAVPEAAATRDERGRRFHGTLSYVAGRFGRRPDDGAALRNIAELFSPACIFDGCGNILHDCGAGQYLESITLDPAPGGPAGARAKVTIRCNRPFAYPPLLSILEPGEATIRVQGGENFDWVFAVDFGRAPAGKRAVGARRYGLEIRLVPRERRAGKMGGL